MLEANSDSESEFASSIKLIVDRKINEGLKEKQIYQFLREKYGDWVIFDPQLNKNTYVLWLLPLLLFLFGGAIMYKKIDEGSSEDQIYDFLRKKYGDWIIYDPKLNKNTYILWLLPLLLFLFGGAIIFKRLNSKK